MNVESSEVELESASGSAVPKVLGALVLLAVCAGLAWLAVDWGFAAGLGALIFGVSGLSLLATAFAWTGRGACTACGKTIDELPSDLEAVRCPHCGVWHRIAGKRMSRTPDDHVASFPCYTITIPVGEQPRLGTRCVCCAQPATSKAPYEMRKTVAGAPGVGRLVKRWTVELPVCASHTTLRPGIDVQSGEGVLRIKSFAALRAS